MWEWPLSYIDAMTMWSLTIIGALLIAGLLTRLSALAAAGWLIMFYLAMPPWPGVPPAPGPEHAFIVNKNLIEAIAALAIAALPTGQWFGLDALLYRLLAGKKGKKAAAPPSDTPDTGETSVSSTSDA